MTNMNIYVSLGGLDPELIEKAAPAERAERKKSRVQIKWGIIAACLSLVAMGGVLAGVLLSPDVPSENIVSGFAITAYAADGSLTELGVEDSCYNSVDSDSQKNVFDVDVPLFSFSVSPANQKEGQAPYSQFDISVSYDGHEVDGKDEHILVTTLIPMPHAENQDWAYSIVGWFTEPTNVVIRILDKSSREIVQTIMVQVTYLPQQNQYELKNIDWNTLQSDQKQALDAQNALMTYFYSKGFVTEYPSFYAGSYIKDNKLYVRLVSPTEKEMSVLSKIFAPYKDVVVYLEATHSREQLQKYADQTVAEMEALGFRVTTWCVDDKTGDILITVLKEDYEAACAWASQALDDEPRVVIEIGGYVIPD